MKCEYCNSEMTGRKRRYCSDGCRESNYKVIKRHKNPIKTTTLNQKCTDAKCKACNAEIFGHKRNYCDRVCARKYYEAAKRNVEKTCERCGESFIGTDEQTLCSSACKRYIVCGHCGVRIPARERRGKHSRMLFCSTRCHGAARSANAGTHEKKIRAAEERAAREAKRMAERQRLVAWLDRNAEAFFYYCLTELQVADVAGCLPILVRSWRRKRDRLCRDCGISVGPSGEVGPRKRCDKCRLQYATKYRREKRREPSTRESRRRQKRRQYQRIINDPVKRDRHFAKHRRYKRSQKGRERKEALFAQILKLKLKGTMNDQPKNNDDDQRTN